MPANKISWRRCDSHRRIQVAESLRRESEEQRRKRALEIRRRLAAGFTPGEFVVTPNGVPAKVSRIDQMRWMVVVTFRNGGEVALDPARIKSILKILGGE